MARRRNRRPPARPQACLSIRFAGPPECGKATALQAVRLLLEDAGFVVRTSSDGPRGADHQLIVTPDTAALADLADWIASEPM
jgi:predicted PilT family ATPase